MSASIELIENRGPNSLLELIKVQCERASEVNLAVAFVTRAGLEPILACLRRVAQRGRVRVLVGLYQHVTEPEALRTLLNLMSTASGRVECKLSREPQFHRKLYIVRNRHTGVAVIGSSNLTGEGLQSGGELNIVIPNSLEPRGWLKICESFERDWVHRAAPLTKEGVDIYERFRRRSKFSAPLSRSALRKILGSKPKHDQASVQTGHRRRYWRDRLTSYLKPKTVEIVEAETGWDRSGYDFAAFGRHSIEIGDRILLFDFMEGRRATVELFQAKDVAEVFTREDRHFIAYRRVVGTLRRHLSLKLCEQLKTIGVIRSIREARIRRCEISADKWSQVHRLFRQHKR